MSIGITAGFRERDYLLPEGFGEQEQKKYSQEFLRKFNLSKSDVEFEIDDGVYYAEFYDLADGREDDDVYEKYLYAWNPKTKKWDFAESEIMD